MNLWVFRWFIHLLVVFALGLNRITLCSFSWSTNKEFLILVAMTIKLIDGYWRGKTSLQRFQNNWPDANLLKLNLFVTTPVAMSRLIPIFEAGYNMALKCAICGKIVKELKAIKLQETWMIYSHLNRLFQMKHYFFQTPSRFSRFKRVIECIRFKLKLFILNCFSHKCTFFTTIMLSKIKLSRIVMLPGQIASLPIY